jgi:diguanylate cyclase (GGDEF)-like protein
MVQAMDLRTKLRRARSRGAVVFVVALAWVGAMFVLAELLAVSQAHARLGTTQRLAARTSAGAEFSSLYVKDILARERVQASIWLAAPHATHLSLERASSALGFGAAVLLDHNGRVLQAAPAKPGLVGQVITGIYPHLATAVAGTAAVSNVVPSEAGGLPVVAFAVPLATASGRRVFDGGFEIADTPLGAYMSHMIVVPGRRVYLTDAIGGVIASSQGPPSPNQTLSQIGNRLATLAGVDTPGSYTFTYGDQVVVSAAVAGTPWRIVVTVPQAALYVSLNGASKTLAWAAVASLTIAGLMIILLGSRLLGSRTRLAMLNSDLDRLARVDALTGLSNRRDIEEALLGALSAARRHESDLAVLLIDIDHFKRINDTLGHQAGDRVLANLGQTLRSVLRTEDIIGRWGGEEFLAVLPQTDADGALVIAERLRAHVANSGPESNDARMAISVTIGVAAWASGGMDDLIRRADGALYTGKAAGRNNVQISTGHSSPSLVEVG